MPRAIKSRVCEHLPRPSYSRLRVCWVHKALGQCPFPVRAHWHSGSVSTPDRMVQTRGCKSYLQLQKASIGVSEVIKNEFEHFSGALRNMSVVYNRLWPFPLTHLKTC